MQTKNEKDFFNGMQTDWKTNFGSKKKAFNKLFIYKTRHLKKRIKEHVPKGVENFCCSDKKDVIPAKVLNASKRLSIVFVPHRFCFIILRK